jgi:2-oxoglutarate/2-oxoacid ferredoxin oxidoreductase subunit beta
MSSLLNTERPPIYCPGCAHERVTHILDKSFQEMGLQGSDIVIVTDTGCSGFFDTNFNTHAFHGLHGRALTYAAGIKLARPELHVVVTMGDGGIGIGGAHLLAACRRNLNMTLLVMNNFNFGMTGGQFSATTPSDAQVKSAFLNQLEKPVDVCRVAASAGAAHVVRCSAYQKNLSTIIKQAMSFKGFSIVDIHGVCTGRFSRDNPLSPKRIQASIDRLKSLTSDISENIRPEYGIQYRKFASELSPVQRPKPVIIDFKPIEKGRKEIALLGKAGQGIIEAGEMICMTAMKAGLQVTQKNAYPTTVLRGPVVSDLVISDEPIGYTGIESPDIIIAIADEGVINRKTLFSLMQESSLVICSNDVDIPPTKAVVCSVDFKSKGIRMKERAIASMVLLSRFNRIINRKMLVKTVENHCNNKSGLQLKNIMNLMDHIEFKNVNCN